MLYAYASCSYFCLAEPLGSTKIRLIIVNPLKRHSGYGEAKARIQKQQRCDSRLRAAALADGGSMDAKATEDEGGPFEEKLHASL